jgi:hypothetical protein
VVMLHSYKSKINMRVWNHHNATVSTYVPPEGITKLTGKDMGTALGREGKSDINYRGLVGTRIRARDVK